MGKSVSWLCAAPESTPLGSPVSDRQTQRQAQAGGGGGREGERGESEDCKVRGAERNETQSQQRSREVESKFLTVPSKFLFLSWLPFFLGSFISAFLCVSSPPPPEFDESFHWSCLSSVTKLTEFLWRVFYLWQNKVWPG